MKFGLGQFTLQLPPWDTRSVADLYEDTLELAAFAEDAGFSSFWLAEHHGARDSYIPSLLPFLSAVAARTRRIELGTGVVLAPLHHPIRLAEDAAVVDCIAGGRLRLGLGLGWVEEEYRMFGASMRSRGRRLAETVEVLRRAWTGEPFTFEGSVVSYDDVVVTPRPANGTIPIYLGGGAEAAIDRAVALGDGHFPPSGQGPGGIVDRAHLIARLRRERGLTAPYRFGCFLGVGFGEDPDDGWRSIRDGTLHIRGSYLMWMQGGRDVERARDVMAEHEQSVRPTAICGTPAQVADEVRRMADGIVEAGLDDPFVSAILVPPGTPLDVAKQRIETFAEHVIARFA